MTLDSEGGRTHAGGVATGYIAQEDETDSSRVSAWGRLAALGWSGTMRAELVSSPDVSSISICSVFLSSASEKLVTRFDSAWPTTSGISAMPGLAIQRSTNRLACATAEVTGAADLLLIPG